MLNLEQQRSCLPNLVNYSVPLCLNPKPYIAEPYGLR